jgi:cytochrome c peroxidase
VTSARATWGLVLALASGVAACTEGKPAPARARVRIEDRTTEAVSREPLGALPKVPELDPRRVALGKRLFNETALSADGKVSCASCHELARGGDDGKRVSPGVNGKLGGVNAPTVFNASLNFVQFWDGRAASLEDQIGGPITNPIEMAMTWPKVLGALKANPSYTADFSAAFPDGVTEQNVRTAIADFERTLLTTGSRFDRFLSGDQGALDAQARAGYETFKAVGCIACHQGSNVGGNMFQRFGVLGDYFKDRGNVTEADYGRYNVTKNESDRFVFRVPSLRNVEHTAPYFHDGSAATLEEAIQVMARYQLGRKLGGEQVASIVAFLRSLSGPALGSAPG